MEEPSRRVDYKRGFHDWDLLERRLRSRLGEINEFVGVAVVEVDPEPKPGETCLPCVRFQAVE